MTVFIDHHAVGRALTFRDCVALLEEVNRRLSKALQIDKLNTIAPRETKVQRAALLSIATVLACAGPGAAETVCHPAENSVPVAIVRLERTARFTEVHIETQAPRSKVCWASSGANSPYLLANGRRYRFVEGDSITNCPATRDYGARETMVLRFEPLDAQIREFSLVEGEGGENQMIDPAKSRGSFWNFLHVKMQASATAPQAPATKPPGPGAIGR